MSEANRPPTPPDALPPELERAIAGRPDAESLRAVWGAIPAAGTPSVDAAARERAWQALLARRDAPGRVPFTDDPAEPLRLHRDGRAGGIASPVARPAARPWALAAALVLSVAGAMAWQAHPERLAVPAGAGARTYRLADGSRLTLAPGSAATLPRGFRGATFGRGAERAVTLDGTAFFAVARDGRPFVVRTGDATVQVLGTRFNVEGAAAGRGTRVAVEEGRVAVSSPVAPGQVQLAAGEGTRIVAGRPLVLQAVPVARLTAWRNGGLAAVDESLGEVLAELQRRFGQSVELAAPGAAALQVTLFYPVAPALERVLSDLCTMHGLAYRRTSGGYVVDAPARPR